MAYFPLFVNLEKQKILIVGGGTIAERRAKTILPFAESVAAVAKTFSEEMTALAAENKGKLLLHCRAFEESDLENAFLVLACTDDHELNHFIVEESRKKGIPANNCSDKEDCDFFFPGLIHKEPFVVGFTASGKAHGLVKEIREKTEKIIDDIIKREETC